MEIARKAIEEYQAYNVYVQECKQKAKDPELYINNDERSEITQQ